MSAEAIQEEALPQVAPSSLADTLYTPTPVEVSESNGLDQIDPSAALRQWLGVYRSSDLRGFNHFPAASRLDAADSLSLQEWGLWSLSHPSSLLKGFVHDTLEE